jgi:polyferredoxin
MECIGCTACIDACDTVMTKLNRPKGLIRYDSMNGLTGGKTRWIRPRILLYTALMLLGTAAMVAGLSTLKPATMSLTRMSGTPYIVQNGTIRNQFLVRVLNKRTTAMTFHAEVADAPPGFKISGLEDGITVPSLGEELRPVVVTLPREHFASGLKLQFRLRAQDGSVMMEKPMPLLGPIF